MFRSTALAVIACLAGTSLAGAMAQTSAVDSGEVSCPGGRLSIYYARGDATASDQALVLIARIGEAAAQCQPDGIDLITEINAANDGEDARAVSLALARLSNVAEALIAEGVSAGRIRVAAVNDANDIGSPMGEVGVMFRKSRVAADDASSPAPAPAPARTTRPSSNAI